MMASGFEDDGDHAKARVFFERGRVMADMGQFDYAIEMYLQGLALDPDAVDAHQELRDVSLRRKAAGKKKLGMFENMKLLRRGKDEKDNLLRAEKVLAYDPGNIDCAQAILIAARAAGFAQTEEWIGRIWKRMMEEGA